MYALSTSDEGDCYLCVPPDPGIEDAALGAGETAAIGASVSAAPGAGESAPSGTVSAQVFHTFTLDSGASCSFFRDRTTLTPLSRPVAVSLADPSGGPVLASFSTVLPCPAAPSGTLSGLYLPSFSTNLVSGADLQDQGVDQFTPASQRVTHCTCARTGRHLATFTRRPGSSLYTLSTESPSVPASGQVAASSQVFAAAPCSCRLLSHQTLLWHHRLGHPSLPRLRGMASSVLVSGLPRSLPPLPPGPAPTCVPCVEGQQRAAPHSSKFPPTEALVQTLHMDVWGPARVRGQGHERYFLLVVDDYSRYTTVFPLHSKGEVTEVLIDWIRAARLQLRESFGSDFLVLRLHSDKGGEFSSVCLGAFYRAQGIRQTFTLPASPQQNGIAERRIGMVMDVARTSMIHAAAPHFLWPFAVQYAAHQLNLQPRVSLRETSPTLRWTGKVGDASAFRVWGSRAFVRDLSADKLSPRAVHCVFLGFPPDAPGWQFYHPTSRRVLSSQDVTFDKSVPYYRLFPYRTAPLPPPPLFLAPGPPPVDPLPPQGPAPSGVSQVDAVEPVEVAVDSGAESGGAEPVGAESGGAEPGGAELGGAESGGAEPGNAEPGGAESARVASRGASSSRELLSPQELRESFARRWSRAAGAGGSPVAPGPGGARTDGTGAVGAGGAAAAAGVGPAGAFGATSAGATWGVGAGVGAAGASGAAGAGATGGVGAGVGPAGGTAGAAGGTGAAGPAGVGAVGAEGDAGAGAATGGTGAVPVGSAGLARPRLYFVPLLEQSQSPLQPVSPLPAPSPYAGPTGGLAERREPVSRPASHVRTSRRAPRPRPPAVPGTHQMTQRPSTAPLRFPLPSPPESSLPVLAGPDSDSLRAASLTVARLLSTVVTDPSFESTAVSAFVAELVDFAARCRLDYTASFVVESESVCPPSVGGECALSMDVLEDRQEEFQFFAAALPHLVSTLLAPEGDPDAPDKRLLDPGGTTAATGSGGTCPGGAGAVAPGGTAEAAGVGPTGGSAGASGGTGAAGSAGPGAAGATGVGVAGGVGTGGSADAGTSEGAGAGAAGAGGATGAGAPAGSPGAVPAGSGGAPRPRPYFVPLLEQVLGLPPSPGPAPPFECPQPVQSQSLLQPVSPLPAPSPYTGPTGGLAERRAPASRPALPARPACTSRCTSRPRPPAVPGTHQMALRPSTAPLRVPLPSPPASSLPAFPDPESDSLRAASPTVARFLATVVTDPSLASTAASALVAELVDFAASCRLDYAASLVAESASVCPPSVGGECALSTDVLEDRQEDFQCFAAALPHLVSTLLAPEGDPDAPDIPTPRSYAEAIEGPYTSQWQATMDAEMASWKSTGTFIDEVPPHGANIVSGMWIFRVKRPPGSPPVFKARYVARGFSQRQGVDYFPTFSPTPKMTTLRVLLHVAAQRDYELHSLDFSTAFLQGSLHEEIWLRRPPGFTGPSPPGTQWSLRRPVYGLRQAPREWHDTLRTTLAALGFAPSSADPSLFLRTDTSLPPFYVLVYVDDLVFATGDTAGLAHVNSELQKRHTCTDLGELRSYLGLQITRDRAQRTITLTQSHMVQQVLQRFDFTYSSPQATPLSTRQSLSALPLDESVEPSGPYPELVGCLMYLMACTRPDLAYPLSILARYVAPGRHRPEHMAAASRLSLTAHLSPHRTPLLMHFSFATSWTTWVWGWRVLELWVISFPSPPPPFVPTAAAAAGGEGVRVWGRRGSGTGVAGVRQPAAVPPPLLSSPLPSAAPAAVWGEGKEEGEAMQGVTSYQVFAAASKSSPASAPCSCRPLSHETLLWHHRLGHPSLPRLRGMASHALVSGLPRSLPPLPPGPALTCVPCVEGRQRAAPQSSSFPPTEAPLQTLQMDMWGPARVRGQGHERYFLLVVDDYSRYTTVFPLRSKEFRLRPSCSASALNLRQGVFLRPPKSLLSIWGIHQTFTLPASPQQNGIAERRIGMVMDVARTSMIHAAAPHFLWPFAVQYATHQINLQPRVSLPETTPTLRWTGKVGDASAFRVWGSRAFVRDTTADKLSSHAVPCVFHGFLSEHIAYLFV
ncbi:unnamed protein product [Closterium sp. NIES-53]